MAERADQAGRARGRRHLDGDVGADEDDYDGIDDGLMFENDFSVLNIRPTKRLDRRRGKGRKDGAGAAGTTAASDAARSATTTTNTTTAAAALGGDVPYAEVPGAPFMRREAPLCYCIPQGRVPGMHVPAKFYASPQLLELLLEEVDGTAAAASGGFVAAVQQVCVGRGPAEACDHRPGCMLLLTSML